MSSSGKSSSSGSGKSMPSSSATEKPPAIEMKWITLKSIVRKLLLERTSDSKRQFLTKEEIEFLLEHCLEALKKDQTLAEVEPPVVVCGDTHGQYYDLLRLFDHGGWPPDSRYLFLGDYVDRGAQSIEVISLMMAFKIAYPDSFYILRGNHECSNINRVYGFWDECKRRYNESIYWQFNRVFNWLPLAALIGGRIFCMHGGLSPDLTSLDQVRSMQRPIEKISGGIAADLLWSDPVEGLKGFIANTRGISYKFGEEAVMEFLRKTGLDMIIRAHQVVMMGYEYFADKHLITLFSAPKYCEQFDNAAAMMVIGPDLKSKIKQLTI